jgi:hypothetical protein
MNQSEPQLNSTICLSCPVGEWKGSAAQRIICQSCLALGRMRPIGRTSKTAARISALNHNIVCGAARPHASELRLNAVFDANRGSFVTAGLLTSNALSALLETSCVFRERPCFLQSAGTRQGTLNGLRFGWLHTSGGKEYGS